MAAKTLLNIEYLRQCFELDAVNGTLTWKARPREHFMNDRGFKVFNTSYAGKIAGSFSDGYVTVKILNKSFKVHRIIWSLYNSQEIPCGMEIDHKDCNRANNRPSNLRLASRHQNRRNVPKLKSNTTGFKGVKKHVKGNFCKYEARIRIDGKPVYIGLFNTPEEAHSAYCKAADKYHKEFARTE